MRLFWIFKYIPRFFVLTLLIGVGIQSHAWANESETIVDYSQKLPDDLRAVPIKYKGLNISPSMSVQGRYDTNVFAAPENEKSDFILAVTPRVRIQAERGRWNHNLFAELEVERYATFETDNQENLQLNYQGTFTPNSKWQFPWRMEYFDTNFDRGSTVTGEPSILEPIKRKEGSAGLGVVRRFNRLSLGLVGDYRDIALEDAISGQDGRTPVFVSVSNRRETSAVVNLGYVLRPAGSANDPEERALLANFGVNNIIYDNRSLTPTGFDGLNQDRRIFFADLGFRLDYKNKLKAQLSAGLNFQQFKEDNIENTTSLRFDGALQYRLTPKLELGFAAVRDSEQDNTFIQGIDVTDYLADIQYELKHNMFMIAYLGLNKEDFFDFGREDETLRAGINLDYFHGPKWVSRFGVAHESSDSTTLDSSFDKTVFSASINRRF